MSVLLYAKFAVGHLAEGQLLHAVENCVKFLILQEGTLKTNIINQRKTKSRS
jgi:hypothetical protein